MKEVMAKSKLGSIGLVWSRSTWPKNAVAISTKKSRPLVVCTGDQPHVKPRSSLRPTQGNVNGFVVNFLFRKDLWMILAIAFWKA